MKKYLEENKEFVLITGFKDLKIGNAKDFLKKIRRNVTSKVWIQFFDSSLIASWQHLFFAILNAQLSFKNKKNISKSTEIEVLLYASTQHQIHKAIKLIGIKDRVLDIALVIVGKNQNQIDESFIEIANSIEKEPDESVIELSEKKIEKIIKEFSISKNEIEVIMKKGDIKRAIRDIILEKMALLSTRS